MVQTIPIFLARIHEGDETHIVAGVEPVTLCDKERIYSAAQIRDTDTPEGAIEEHRRDEVEFCESCLEEWSELSDGVQSEPTMTCHACRNIYSGHRGRTVEHMAEGEVGLCKPCYKTIREDDSSSISKPYEEAEPFMEIGNSREFNSRNSEN